MVKKIGFFIFFQFEIPIYCFWLSIHNFNLFSSEIWFLGKKCRRDKTSINKKLISENGKFVK